MADIKEALAVLVSLQEKDRILDSFRQKAGEFPGEIEKRKKDFEDLRRETEEKKKGLSQLKMLKKNKEMELETLEADIRKHNLELNAVKSNDAYKALLKEIGEGKKASSNIETEILDLMERLEQAAQMSLAADQEVKLKEREMQDDIIRLEEEYKKMQAQVTTAELERATAVSIIPEAILKQYDHIRKVREGVGVAAIEGETCGECNMLLRPALINEVYKALEFVSCDSCSRILYRKPDNAEKKS